MSDEPELTCPHIDRFIVMTNPPQEVRDEFEAVRMINSQLRYGLWHEKARADEAEAKLARLAPTV